MDNRLFPRFIRGVTSTGIGSSVQLVFGLLGIMVAVRFVPKEEFGLFVLIQVVASFFVMLSSLLLQAISVTRFIVSSDEPLKKEVANSSVYMTLFISVGIIIIMILGRPIISFALKSTPLSGLFPYIPIFYLLTNFDVLFQRMQQGFHQYKKLALAQGINAAIRFVLIILFLPLLGMGLAGLLFSFIISYVVSILYQYFSLPIRKEFSCNFDIFRQMLKFGFPLGLNSAMMFVLTRIDRLMLGALAGTAGVASYDVASRIPENARNFYQSFESVFFPNMAELYTERHIPELEAVLNNSLRLIGFLTSLAALILTLFQKEIVVLLFSDRYLSSAPALSILMVAMSLALAGNLLGTSLVSFGQSDKPVKINLVGTLITIAGNLIMIPILGFMGAVYTVLFSRCATLPLNFFFLKKSDITARASEYLKPFGAFVLCAMIFILANSDVLLFRSFLIFLFLIICGVFSVIKKEDFSLLRMELQQAIIRSSRFQSRKL